MKKRNMKKHVVSGFNRNSGISKAISDPSVGMIFLCNDIIIEFSLSCSTLSKKISRGMIIIANVIQMIFNKLDVLYLSNFT